MRWPPLRFSSGSMRSMLAAERRLATKRRNAVTRRRVQRMLIAALVWSNVLVAACLIVCILLYVVPAVDPPKRSDAVVVLAPTVESGRLDYAQSLMAQGYGATLVVSVPNHGGKDSSDICRANRPYRVICFGPDPMTTRGEARAIQKYSEENAWRSITVVTDDSHVTRARTLIERCYSYELRMAAVRRERSLSVWAYRFVYESAALVKAAAERGC